MEQSKKLDILFNRLAGKKKNGLKLSQLVWAESEGRQRFREYLNFCFLN